MVAVGGGGGHHGGVLIQIGASSCDCTLCGVTLGCHCILVPVEQSCQHRVAGNNDGAGVVCHTIAPRCEVVAVGGGGGHCCRVLKQIGAGSSNYTLRGVALDSHRILVPVEQGCQHGVAGDDDGAGVVGHAVTPRCEVVAVSGGGGYRGCVLIQIGASSCDCSLCGVTLGCHCILVPVEQGCQHGVAGDYDSAGVVGHAVTPHREVVAVGGGGGHGCRVLIQIGASTCYCTLSGVALGCQCILVSVEQGCQHGVAGNNDAAGVSGHAVAPRCEVVAVLRRCRNSGCCGVGINATPRYCTPCTI